jgi:hypothetical protein
MVQTASQQWVLVFWIEYAEGFIEMQQAAVPACRLITCLVCFPLPSLFRCYEFCSSNTRTRDLTSAGLTLHVQQTRKEKAFSLAAMLCAAL